MSKAVECKVKRIVAAVRWLVVTVTPSVRARGGCPSCHRFDSASALDRCKTFCPAARSSCSSSGKARRPLVDPDGEKDAKSGEEIPEIPQTGEEQTERVNLGDDEAAGETQEADEEHQEAAEEKQQVVKRSQIPVQSLVSADASADVNANASADGSVQLIEAYLLNLVQDDFSDILEVIKTEMASSTKSSMSSSPSPFKSVGASSPIVRVPSGRPSLP
ncbi:hypothetical protein C8J56DRAFT_1027550 [Mycena floridula]|nr:hypothetical protein C8J56DRAFT_1027550 [Mycena floridula]